MEKIMKRIIVGAVAALLSAAALATTYTPLSVISMTGSTSGQAIVSTGPTTSAAWTSIVDSVIAGAGIAVSGTTGNVTVSVATNGVALGQLAQQAANTVLGNATGSTANVTALAVPSCSTSSSALQSVSGTGFACNTGLLPSATAASTYATIAQATTALAATGGSISGVAGSFTTLKASAAAKLTYSKSTAQSLTGTAAALTGWTSTFDANSNFNASTGTFTAPSTGYYFVSGQIAVVLSSPAVGSQTQATVMANGVAVTTALHIAATTAEVESVLPFCVAVSLAAGQTVQIFGYSSTTFPTATNALLNFLSIVQIP